MKKILSLFLVFVMLLGMMPMQVFAEEAVGEETNSFKGKKVSILSHSMSTYNGVSNSTAANSTLGNNDVYYTEGRHDVYLNDTWWMQTIDALDMELLVNNSWSGSCVFMPRKGEASVGYGDRAVNLHNDHTGEEPDVIFVYLGCNDFAYYKDTFGKAEDVNYAALIQENLDGTYTYAEPTSTCEAYAILLHKAATRYPDAEIYCMTSTARRETDYTGDSYPDAGQPTEYSAQLHQVAQYYGYPVIDLENAIPKDVEIFDKYIGDKRAHANALGMDQITNEVLSVLLGEDAQIRHVICEDGTVQEQAVLLGGSYSAEVKLQDGYAVTVTMNDIDITQEVVSNGKITIDEVTGDIEVCAIFQREPQSFRWELQQDTLTSVGNTENTVTKLAGTVTNGVLSNTRYQLSTPVVLKHDLPWKVEWQFGGNWRGCVFTSDPVQSTKDMVYLSRTVGGQLCIGTWTGSQYDNYGVDLSGLDDQVHTYRFENRIAADGSNMIWLSVDGEEIGPMNQYFIGSKDQGKTSDWVCGKDFIFPYISMDGHALKECKLDYLQIQEDVPTQTVQPMSMSYDDHLDMSEKNVEILDAGTPTSYQVGYGVEENTVRDTAVVTLRDNTLVATGIGTAMVKIDDEIYEVTVTAAPISLLLLIGQSNMRGSEGNADQSIVCPDGMVYATFGDDRGDAEGIMNVNNATNFSASALTGPYSTINVNGTTENLSYYPINSLTEAGKGTFGPDSGFAYEWVKQTGEKVWVVNAAHGGSSITSWQPNATNFKEAVLLFSACQETLRKEIAAGHFTLSHMGYFWCQGCSDYNWTAEKYVTNYLAMHDGLKSSLAFDHDSSDTTDSVIFEFAGIIPVRAGHDYNDGYREDVYTDTTSYKFYESFMDLQMTGPRVAQYWMTNQPELADIWNVCNIGEDWVWMPDGTNGVSEYFQSHYTNGTVDYTTQVAQKASWYTPTTPAAVHDSIHYNQIGYNEVGRESARNALILLGEIAAPEMETTVELLTWDGYTAANQISASLTGNSETLIVPKIDPVWKSKEVSYTLAEGFTWTYYDVLASDEGLTGTLTMADQTINIEGHSWSEWKTLYQASADGPGKEERICSHCNKVETREMDGVWQIYNLNAHLLELPEDICCDTNLWSILPHEDVHFTSGKKWGTTSTYTTSITIPVDSGDRLYATSWKKAVENGHATSNGIRVTFFDANGIAKTMGPGQTDREFYANGGYLVAPEGTIAVNIVMWYDSEDYEVYILNRDHIYENGTCAGCGDHKGAIITQQPTDVTVDLGEKFKITVEAEGEGLTYQWYYSNNGGKSFAPSSFKTKSYALTMASYCHNRQVYCVITDAEGNEVRTETATISRPPLELTILTQPQDVQVEIGEKFKITVEASGDGLTYQWYYKDKGGKEFKTSAYKSKSYSLTMASYCHGRQIYCVITDQYGNQVTTETVTMTRPPVELKLLSQPTDVFGATGEKFSVNFSVQGDGLTYQWYYKDKGGKIFKVSSYKSRAYAMKMASYMDGRQVYCVITDAYGNQVTTDVATIHVEK